jgi:hypothetical protein
MAHMTLTVDEILAAPRADRMRLIRENVDTLSGEDINKITTSLLQDIQSNLRKSAPDLALRDLPERPLFRAKPASSVPAAPPRAEEPPVPTVEEIPALPDQEEVREEPMVAIAQAETPEVSSDEGKANGAAGGPQDFSAWLEPQPEVPLLPPPSDEEIQGDVIEDGEGYETAALMMPDALIGEEAAEFEEIEAEDDDLAASLAEEEADLPAAIEVPTATGTLVALPTAQAVAQLAKAQAEEEKRADEAEEEVHEENSADQPDVIEAITDAEEDDGLDIEADIETNLAEDLREEEFEEDFVEAPLPAKVKEPLVLGVDDRIPSHPVPNVGPAERYSKAQKAFDELEAPEIPESDDIKRDTQRWHKLRRGILGLLPMPIALAATYFGTEPASTLIGAEPYFDPVIGIVILLNVCWMICELTGVAFRENMVLATRLAFIISLYYPLEILVRYIGGGAVGIDSLIYLIMPAGIGLVDLWASKRQ